MLLERNLRVRSCFVMIVLCFLCLCAAGPPLRDVAHVLEECVWSMVAEGDREGRQPRTSPSELQIELEPT